jgi:outer membrane murein-binding lipoprotein Lpp
MEGDALINLGEDLKKEQQKILDFYASQTGKAIEDIQPLMQKATDLTSTEALSMGFATDIITGAVNYHPYKLVAMVAPKEKQKEKQMTDTKKDNWLARQFTKLAAKINGVTLNMEMPVKDGSGNDVTLFIETETEDLTGKKAFLIDAEDNQVVAPDGDYTDNDGKVIKVAGGLVTDVVAKATEKVPETPTVEELNAKIAELESVKASLSTELEASKAENAKVSGELVAFKAEFEPLKSFVIGKGASFNASTQSFEGDKVAKTPSYGDQVLAKFKK